MIQPDKDTRSGIQQQAQVIWAWVEILLPVASQQGRGEGALQHLNTVIGNRPETGSWGFENLLASCPSMFNGIIHTDRSGHVTMR